MARTFFQAIDDKHSTRGPRALTFEDWLDDVKAKFNKLMGAEKYPYELLHAFYPKGGIDDIVPVWEAGTLPSEYAAQQYRTARPAADML